MAVTGRAAWLKLPVPKFQNNALTRLPVCPEGAIALLLAEWASAAGNRGLIYLAESNAQAHRVHASARLFGPNLEHLLLAGSDRLPYEQLGRFSASAARRMAILFRLACAPEGQPRLLIAAPEAALSRVPLPALWACDPLTFSVSDRIDMEEVKEKLVNLGFTFDERVDEPGEAAVRGSVIEIFAGDSDLPCRLEIEEGQIAHVRMFDPITQRIISEDKQFAVGAVAPPQQNPGSDEPGTIFDYLPKAVISVAASFDQRREVWVELIRDAYEHYKAAAPLEAGSRSLVKPPDELYCLNDSWTRLMEDRTLIRFDSEKSKPAMPKCLPGNARSSHLRTATDLVLDALGAGDRVVIIVPDRSSSTASRLCQRIERSGYSIFEIDAWTDLANLKRSQAAILCGALNDGFATRGLSVFAGRDLGLDSAISNASVRPLQPPPLRVGDHVVHEDHGVGILQGIETIENGGAKNDVVRIKYAGSTSLAVPVDMMDRVWRYGSAAAALTLDRLNTGAWQAKRQRVESEIKLAARALARRLEEKEQAKGLKIEATSSRYEQFVARFPYELTSDQQAAVQHVLADMSSGRKMDRLVVGDVGYGKTEVALRAVAAAVFSGHQAMLVVPTLVLAQQHLGTLRRRFSHFSVEVAAWDRGTATSDKRRIMAGLQAGSTPILVATTGIRLGDLRFRKLALIVIDEEHRLGSAQKQDLRDHQPGVHVLSLSATPIPRTLQQARIGLREHSIIATPPVKRRPVRTLLSRFEPSIVRNLLRREARRGGQSFVVCPRIADLPAMKDRLMECVPELDVVCVHGRSPPSALNRTMLQFAAGKHDLLLTTSIIESGLDIPNANTLIVWRPERFGMSELHQLRGRVGRGERLAVVYLALEGKAEIAAKTLKRLESVAALAGSGAGLAVAQADLDTRGAGELFGEDQAGYVELLGAELYEDLLVRRVAGKGSRSRPPKLLLGIGNHIPPSYIPEVDLRIELYRRMAKVVGLESVSNLYEEVIDRFGQPPEETELLFQMLMLRERCRAAGVAQVKAGSRGIAIEQVGVSRSNAPGGQSGPAQKRKLLLKASGLSASERIDAVARLLARQCRA